MIERGEPYIMMEKMAAAKPQKIFLGWEWRASRDTKATAEKIESTRAKRAEILAFSLLGAKMRKVSTYIASSPAPVPLMIDTNVLFGDTIGRPYLFIYISYPTPKPQHYFLFLFFWFCKYYNIITFQFIY